MIVNNCWLSRQNATIAGFSTANFFTLACKPVVFPVCQSSTGESSSFSHLPVTPGTLSDCLTHFQLSPFHFCTTHVCSSKSTLICACTASIHLYLLLLPFLLSPSLWAGRKMRAASANYDYAHSKGPSLDLQFLSVQAERND